ncbi:serine hydrolase domain-containing protein [Paenibacillus sp. D51F]
MTTTASSRCGSAIMLTDKQAMQLDSWKIKGIYAEQGGKGLLEWTAGGPDRPASIYSCTKSVLSALIGIAVGQGLIGSVADPVFSYLDMEEEGTAKAIKDDPRKRDITIEHLLTMTSGLDWPDFDKPYWEMKKAASPAAFVMGRELAHEPGTTFTYNTGGSQLLSIILTRTAQESLPSFARNYLFRPAGIGSARWNRLGEGHEAGAGLSMGMKDLSRFGRLYLQQGMWNGEQIIPQKWIVDSQMPHHKGLLHYEPSIYGSYGYHWWVSPEGKQDGPDYFFALGYGGQYLFVIPSLDMTVVVRKSLDGRSKSIYSRRVLTELVIPAVTGHTW